VGISTILHDAILPFHALCLSPLDSNRSGLMVVYSRLVYHLPISSSFLYTRSISCSHIMHCPWREAILVSTGCQCPLSLV